MKSGILFKKDFGLTMKQFEFILGIPCLLNRTESLQLIHENVFKNDDDH